MYTHKKLQESHCNKTLFHAIAVMEVLYKEIQPFFLQILIDYLT